MTIREAIAAAAQQRKPSLPFGDAVRVLNDVDERIMREVVSPRGLPPTTWERYTEETADRELLAPAPYDRMYVHAINAELDDRENQYGNMSNSRRYYEYNFQKFAEWFIRTNRPRRGRLRSWWYGV